MVVRKELGVEAVVALQGEGQGWVGVHAGSAGFDLKMPKRNDASLYGTSGFK